MHWKKVYTTTQVKMQICGSMNHLSSVVSMGGYVEDAAELTTLAVCRSNNGRRGPGHEVEQDTMRDKQVNMVNTNSFSFNSIGSVIIPKLNTSVLEHN